MRITPELFRRNCSSCAHRALIVHFELAFVLCSCSAWAHHSPSPHQIPSAFTDTAQRSLSFHSAFPHSPFNHCSLTVPSPFKWGKRMFQGLYVSHVFYLLLNECFVSRIGSLWNISWKSVTASRWYCQESQQISSPKPG